MTLDWKWLDFFFSLPHSPTTLNCIWHKLSGLDSFFFFFFFLVGFLLLPLLSPPPPFFCFHEAELSGRMKTRKWSTPKMENKAKTRERKKKSGKGRKENPGLYAAECSDSCKSCRSPPTLRAVSRHLGGLRTSWSQDSFWGAENWDSAFNIYSNRQGDDPLSQNFLFTCLFSYYFYKKKKICPHPTCCFMRACKLPLWERSSAPVENIQLSFGTKSLDPKSIAADENQSIDLNWLWGRILDAEVAKIAWGLGIAVCSCHLGTAMKRLDLALFWLPDLFK